MYLYESRKTSDFQSDNRRSHLETAPFFLFPNFIRYSPSYVTYVCIEILGGTTRGCGDAIPPMLITAIGVCVLRVTWVLLAVPLRPEVSTVAFSYPLTWTVTSLFFIVYYLRGNWLKRCRGMAH